MCIDTRIAEGFGSEEGEPRLLGDAAIIQILVGCLQEKRCITALQLLAAKRLFKRNGKQIAAAREAARDQGGYLKAR